MNALPTGWTESTLGKACIRASKVNPKDEPEKEITYLDIGGIDNETLKIAETKTYNGAEAPSRARQLVKEGDVLFSTVRTYLRKIAQVPKKYDGGVASTGFTVLRGNEALDSKYLFHYVTQDTFIKPLTKIQRGTSYPAVRDSDVFAQPIPLPPLLEQRRIVARIEELFSRLDAGVAALRRAKAQLKRYRQSVLAAAVTGELTRAWRKQHPDVEPAEKLLERILAERRKQWKGKGKYKEPRPLEVFSRNQATEKPSHWPLVNLDMIVEQPQYGTSKKCTYNVAGSSVLRIPNVIDGVIDPTDLKYAAFEDSEIQKLSVRENDLLMIRSNGSLSIVGKTALVREPDTKHLYAGYLIRIRPSTPSVEGRFLSLALASRPMRSQIEQKAKSTSGVNNINAKEIQALTLSLPPLAEQHEIVAEVEARTTAIDHLESDLDAQIIRSARLRQSILSEAFTGNLVPQKPGAEPAAPLLEAAKAKKTKAQKKKLQAKKKPMKPRKTSDLRAQVIQAIENLEADQFSFDELFAKINADYDKTKDVIFELLGDENSEIAQEFDDKSRRVVLTRRMPK